MDKSDQQSFQDRFIKNIDFFQKFYPNVIQKLNSLNNKTPNFEIGFDKYIKEESYISLLNLQFIQTKEKAYQTNPITLSQTQAQNALEKDIWISFNSQDVNKQKNIKKMIFISNGLGYNLIEYNKLYNLKSLLIIEEDIEVFKYSLFNVDYEELANDKSIDFCLAEDDETKKNLVLKFYHSLFFYNDSFKIAQFFSNKSINYIISILQENIHDNLNNKYLNYKQIIHHSISSENIHHLYTSFTESIFNNHQYTKKNIFLGINLVAYLNQSPELKHNSLMLNTIYTALYYITSVEKDQETLHIHTNSFYVLAKLALLGILENEIYEKMIFLYKKAKNVPLHIFFLEHQLNQLNNIQTKTDKIVQSINHKSYLLDALKEKSLEKSSSEYVKNEFDNFAAHFENTLQHKLEYNIPKELYEQLEKYIIHDKKYAIVDLGCGTGLLGEKLQEIATNMIGVDLSTKMIEIAAQKKIYSNLIESDIETYLTHEVLNKSLYDMYTATDVFVYIGSLNKIFEMINCTLSNQGYFSFSIELLENEENYKLNNTGRFSHSLKYITTLVDTYGFSIIYQKPTIIRLELNEPVNGYIFILQKNKKED